MLNDVGLSQRACDLIVNPQHDVLMSPASYWEIAIKISIGRYQLPEDSFERWMQQQLQVNEFEILLIAISHAATVVTLPFHHRDPFDRLLIAQALTEQIPIISADQIFDRYSVVRYW